MMRPIPSLDEVKEAMYMPRSKFREQAETMLAESEVMERAKKSEVYRLLWGGKSYSAELAVLQEVPVLTPDFYTGFKERDPLIPSGPVKQANDGWLCSTGSRKMKFYPFSEYDTRRLGAYGSRYAFMSELSKGDVVINIGAEPPHCSQIMSGWTSDAYGLGSIPVTRGIMARPQELMGSLMKNAGSIVGLTGVPPIGIRFLDTMAEKIPAPLKKVFPKLRMAVMAGEAMNGKQREAFGRFGVEAYEMYGSAELSSPAVECKHHRGSHMFLDDNIYQLMTDEGPKWLWECKKGDIGPLRATTPNREAFALINYDIGDVIEIIDTECPCGITAPNARVISRTDKVLNIGGAKTYENHIERRFEEVGQEYLIPDWQIHWSKDSEGKTHKFDILIDNGGLDKGRITDAILDSLSKDQRTEQLFQAYEAGILNVNVHPVPHDEFQKMLVVNGTPKRLRIVKKF
ncbi:MAG: hypothetical protein V1887_02050 [Candidatus Aenigmatarchaeota archaeon]